MAENRCRVCDKLLDYKRGSVCRTEECSKAEALRVSAELLAGRQRRRLERIARHGERRKQFTPVARRRIHEANGWTCYLCGEPTDGTMRKGEPDAAVIDHKVPLSRGGTNDPSNLGTAHHRCNIDKWTKTPDEFFAQRDV